MFFKNTCSEIRRQKHALYCMRINMKHASSDPVSIIIPLFPFTFPPTYTYQGRQNTPKFIEQFNHIQEISMLTYNMIRRVQVQILHCIRISQCLHCRWHPVRMELQSYKTLQLQYLKGKQQGWGGISHVNPLTAQMLAK